MASAAWGSLSGTTPNVKSIDLVGETLTIGRSSSCTSPILDLLVSGKHCSFRSEPQGGVNVVIVTDTSSNGTYVNGVKLGKGNDRTLVEGDIIAIVMVQKEHPGIAFTFSPLSLKQLRGPEPIEKLEELLIGNIPDIVAALSSATPTATSQEVADALVALFESRGHSLPLLLWAVSAEVAVTERPSELFRGQSVPTKVIAEYAHIVGDRYLKSTLQPAVTQIVAQGRAMEVDPDKLVKGDDLAANLSILNLYSDLLVTLIFASIRECPVTFAFLFSHMKAVVLARWPEEQHIAVGGFVFLRFFCPALVSAQRYGIVESALDERNQRSLMLLAKVLQNLANGKEFGKKEAYMIPMNPFIIANLERAKTFFDQISTLPEGGSLTPPPSIQAFAVPPLRKAAAMRYLVRCLKAERAKLTAALAPSAESAAATAPERSEMDRRQALCAEALALVDSIEGCEDAPPLPSHDIVASAAAAGASGAGASAPGTPFSSAAAPSTPLQLGSHGHPADSARANLLSDIKAGRGAMSRKPTGTSVASGQSTAAGSNSAAAGDAGIDDGHVETIVPAMDISLVPVDFAHLRTVSADDPLHAVVERQYSALLARVAALEDQLRVTAKERRRWHSTAVHLAAKAGLPLSRPEPGPLVYGKDKQPFSLFML